MTPPPFVERPLFRSPEVVMRIDAAPIDGKIFGAIFDEMMKNTTDVQMTGEAHIEEDEQVIVETNDTPALPIVQIPVPITETKRIALGQNHLITDKPTSAPDTPLVLTGVVSDAEAFPRTTHGTSVASISQMIRSEVPENTIARPESTFSSAYDAGVVIDNQTRKPPVQIAIEEVANKFEASPQSDRKLSIEPKSEPDASSPQTAAKAPVASTMPSDPDSAKVHTMPEPQMDIQASAAHVERSASPQTQNTFAPALQADTARQAANQMAIAISEKPGGVTEIALNPEELGRVRLSVTATDTAITLNVLTERPETNDLLRRHIETLAQEFRALGFDDISFSFSGGEKSGDEKGPAPSRSEMVADSQAQDQLETVQQHSGSGLDLRL